MSLKDADLLHEGIRFGAGCTFIDYNRDGLLDLFVSNYVDIDLAHAAKPSLDILNCNYEGVPVACGPKGLKAPPQFLYRNNGDGTFTDVSRESGIASFRGSYGLTAVAFDADEDGWPDIFVACDTTSSLLLLNNHDGTFREEGLMRGVAISPEGMDMAGMGVGIGDYDLDGHLDIVKTHFQLQPTGLYHNIGKGEFEDNAHEAGICRRANLCELGRRHCGSGQRRPSRSLLGYRQRLCRSGADQSQIPLQGSPHPLSQSRQRNLRTCPRRGRGRPERPARQPRMCLRRLR